MAANIALLVFALWQSSLVAGGRDSEHGPAAVFLRGHPDGVFMVPPSELRAVDASSSFAQSVLGLVWRALGLGPRAGLGTRLSALLESGPRDDWGTQLLVRCEAGFVHAVRTSFDPALERSAFIPDDTFALLAPRAEAVVARLRRHPRVIWVGHMRPEWKHEPRLHEHGLLHHDTPFALRERGVHLAVTLLVPEAARLAREWQRRFGSSHKTGGTPVHCAPNGDRVVQVHAVGTTSSARSQLLAVARDLRGDARVHWVGVIEAPTLKNFMAARSVQAGDGHASAPTKLWDKGITGRDQIVHVHDTGLDGTNCLFGPNADITFCEDCPITTFLQYTGAGPASFRSAIKSLTCQESWFTTSSSSFNFGTPASTVNTAETGMGASSTTASAMYTYLCDKYTNSAEAYSCLLANVTSYMASTFDNAWAYALNHLADPRKFCDGYNTTNHLTVSTGASGCTFSSLECTARQTGTGQPKVQAYWAYADTYEETYAGHGTHVAGSVAGYSQYATAHINRYKGVAHNATIVFSDASMDGNSVLTPTPLTEVFRWSYALGARISTHSWGDSSNQYNANTALIDGFVASNPDMLILFAAGNSGQNGQGSLGSQANAKNIITVGAASQPMLYEVNVTANVSAALARARILRTICNATVLSANSRQIFRGINDVIGNQCGASNQFASPGVMSAYFCDGSKIDSDANWRTYACQIANSDHSDCRDLILRGVGYRRDWPYYDKVFLNQWTTACSSSLSSLHSRSANGEIGEAHMAYFSSRGPTGSDSRLKPELVAPGYYVVSANSDLDDSSAQCSDPSLYSYGSDKSLAPALYATAGTSMATPVTAGAVALVRQWYVDGFADTGAESASSSVTPSAALLKATLIASTVPVRGNIAINSSYTRAIGSNIQEDPYITGYGFVQLASALFFTGDLHQLYHYMGSIGSNKKQTFNVTLHSGQAYQGVRAVLVWTDPAASVSSSKYLVNDLDLTVTVGGGSTMLGNAATLGTSSKDSTNNYEAVNTTSGTSLTIVVDVTAASINSGDSQAYALVLVSAKYASVVRTETDTSSGGGGSSSPSDAVIAVAVVFSLLGVAAILGLAYFFYRRRQSAQLEG